MRAITWRGRVSLTKWTNRLAELPCNRSRGLTRNQEHRPRLSKKPICPERTPNRTTSTTPPLPWCFYARPLPLSLSIFSSLLSFSLHIAFFLCFLGVSVFISIPLSFSLHFSRSFYLLVASLFLSRSLSLSCHFSFFPSIRSSLLTSSFSLHIPSFLRRSVFLFDTPSHSCCATREPTRCDFSSPSFPRCTLSFRLPQPAKVLDSWVDSSPLEDGVVHAAGNGDVLPLAQRSFPGQTIAPIGRTDPIEIR